MDYHCDVFPTDDAEFRNYLDETGKLTKPEELINSNFTEHVTINSKFFPNARTFETTNVCLTLFYADVHSTCFKNRELKKNSKSKLG